MNFRGQIGRIISTFPVLVLLFLILGIYLFLSGVFSLKQSSSVSFVSDINFNERSNILLKEININGEKMTLIDAIFKSKNYFNDLSKKYGSKGERISCDGYMRIGDGVKILDEFKNVLNNPDSVSGSDYFGFSYLMKREIIKLVERENKDLKIEKCLLVCTECDDFPIEENSVKSLADFSHGFRFAFKSTCPGLLFKFDKENKFIGSLNPSGLYSGEIKTSDYQENIDGKLKLKINLNFEELEKEENLVYYYGECL